MKKSLAFLSSSNTASLFSVIFYLTFTIPVSSQDINNETNFFIPSGMKMYTEGSLLNTGFFQNNGSFSLSGNWMNTLVYQGTGSISLEGADQLINNNSQAMAHLALNGGGVKILQGLLSITNSIDFNQGIILVGNADTLILDVDCIASNGSFDSYVDGALVSVGGGYKVFPVGKNGKYHPVTMESIMGINPVLQIEVFENLPNVEVNALTIVKQDIYWERRTISGFFEGTPINFGYNLQSSNPSRLVILESNAVDELFTVRDSVQFSTAVIPNSINSVRFLTKNIFVLGESILAPLKKYYLSTTLSPNANNPDNRSVKIFGENITPNDFSFQVYNRWGLLIFETASYEKMKNQGWEGSQNGSILPSGIYPYSVKYIDTNGRFGQQTGFITIIH